MAAWAGVLVVVLMLHGGLARAEERSGPPIDLAAAGISGSITLQYFLSNHGIDDRRHFPGLDLVLKQRRTLAEGVRWVAEGRVLAQQVGHEDEDAAHGSVRSLRYADEVTSELREGYLEVAGERWEVRVGKQIIVWGRADEINPTDVITPKNFLLLLPEGQAGYRFGVNALKADYFLPWSLRATAIWVPLLSPSLIPLSDLPSGVKLEERLPAAQLEEGSAGLKVDRSGGKVDASASYYYGFNLLPEVRLDRILSAPAAEPAVAIALAHSRQHVFGVDFATTSGRFGYRGEIAYVHTDNSGGRRVDGPTPHFYYVLGVERSLFDNLSVIVQYVGRYVRRRIDPRRALLDPDSTRGWVRYLAARETLLIHQQLDSVQNGWSLRLNQKFWNDTLDCELLTLHYVERNDLFLRPRISYDLADGWRATVGAEIFRGPRNSFFGRVEDNSGAFVALTYSY